MEKISKKINSSKTKKLNRHFADEEVWHADISHLTLEIPEKENAKTFAVKFSNYLQINNGNKKYSTLEGAWSSDIHSNTFFEEKEQPCKLLHPLSANTCLKEIDYTHKTEFEQHTNCKNESNSFNNFKLSELLHYDTDFMEHNQFCKYTFALKNRVLERLVYFHGPEKDELVLLCQITDGTQVERNQKLITARIKFVAHKIVELDLQTMRCYENETTHAFKYENADLILSNSHCNIAPDDMNRLTDNHPTKMREFISENCGSDRNKIVIENGSTQVFKHENDNLISRHNHYNVDLMITSDDFNKSIESRYKNFIKIISESYDREINKNVEENDITQIFDLENVDLISSNDHFNIVPDDIYKLTDNYSNKMSEMIFESCNSDTNKHIENGTTQYFKPDNVDLLSRNNSFNTASNNINELIENRYKNFIKIISESHDREINKNFEGNNITQIFNLEKVDLISRDANIASNDMNKLTDNYSTKMSEMISENCGSDIENGTTRYLKSDDVDLLTRNNDFNTASNDINKLSENHHKNVKMILRDCDRERNKNVSYTAKKCSYIHKNSTRSPSPEVVSKNVFAKENLENSELSMKIKKESTTNHLTCDDTYSAFDLNELLNYDVEYMFGDSLLSYSFAMKKRILENMSNIGEPENTTLEFLCEITDGHQREENQKMITLRMYQVVESVLKKYKTAFAKFSPNKRRNFHPPR